MNCNLHEKSKVQTAIHTKMYEVDCYLHKNVRSSLRLTRKIQDVDYDSHEKLNM